MTEQPSDPRTPAEWQDAVDSAEFCLALQSARDYGLIAGGPGVNVDRCAELLARGAAIGIFPAPLDQLAQRYL